MSSWIEVGKTGELAKGAMIEYFEGIGAEGRT